VLTKNFKIDLYYFLVQDMVFQNCHVVTTFASYKNCAIYLRNNSPQISSLYKETVEFLKLDLQRNGTNCELRIGMCRIPFERLGRECKKCKRV